jgi:hypothetical protein
MNKHPKYMVWVAGDEAAIGRDGRDAFFNGTPLAGADLHFVWDTDEPSSFNIAVETPAEGIALMRRIAHNFGFGIIELEEDGLYHEWYSEEGESASEIANALDDAANSEER